MAFSFGSSLSQPASTAATGGFSFGSTAKPTFGFGSTPAQSTSSLFGSTATTSSAASTGFGTGSTFGFGGQATTQSTLGTSLGFGNTTAATQQTAATVDPNLLLLRQRAALTQPQIHGDERDGIIAKLNQLQAYWGTGKGFFSQQEAVDFTPENQFCRFKVVGYNRLPTASETDGFVSIQVKKKESEVRQQQQALVQALHKALGSKPTLMVCVEGVKPLPEDRTEVVIYVVERQQNGSSKIYSASEVAKFFNQQNMKTQLQTIGIESCLAKTSMNTAQLQQYLEKPAAGIHPLLWEQAKKDNPDPQKLIPVPITGFSELKRRLKYQEQETLQHQKRLALISEEIATLQHNHATTMAKLAQFKRKHQELSHRVLEVMIKQESVRKKGYSVQADEEQLRVQLESIQAELNAPLQFKARLNELTSQIRLQQSQAGASQGAGADGKYVMDAALQGELKQHIEQQQTGLMHLVSVIKEDMEDLKTIEQGLSENMASVVRG